MAYLMTHFWPGATMEQYRASVAVVHPPGGLPDGQVYHAAGPTDPRCGALSDTRSEIPAAESCLVRSDALRSTPAAATRPA